MALYFRYEFFPVGQGLFTYGELGSSGKGPKIRWVYDCGTTSNQALLDAQLNVLVAEQAGVDKLDLLFISHFDKDHISGVAKLLGKFKIGAILLPYMTPEQLLLHAIHSGVEPGDPEFGFFINPSDFLATAAARAEKRIDRIVYVPPSDGEGPDVPNNESAPDEDNTGDLDIPVLRMPEGSEHLQVTDIKITTQVQQLAPEVAIKSGLVWEFVMYNNAPPAALLSLDVKAVAKQRIILVTSDIEEVRETAMQAIKKLFSEKLRSGYAKNLISLFVYAGPTFPMRRHGFVEVSMDALEDHLLCLHDIHHGPLRLTMTPCIHGSALYTGDGYLNTRPKLKRLTTYMRGERIARSNVLQVMHHGAKGNWRLGVAAALHPHFSVFSADPAHRGFGHPHAEVVQDFKPYNVVLVDRTQGFDVRYHRS